MISLGTTELVTQPLYDTEPYPCEGTARVDWFSRQVGSMGKTWTQTNMVMQNTAPWEMRVRGIAQMVVYPPGKRLPVMRRWREIITRASFQLRIVNKSYLHVPLAAIPLVAPGAPRRRSQESRRLLGLAVPLLIQPFMYFAAEAYFEEPVLPMEFDGVGIVILLLGERLRALQ